MDDRCYPSEETQKRLLAQYVPKDKLDVSSLLKLIPTFILLSPLPIRVCFFHMEKKSGYTLSYIEEDGTVWYTLTDRSFAEAVGRFFAYMLEYDKGDASWTMPENPKAKGAWIETDD